MPSARVLGPEPWSGVLTTWSGSWICGPGFQVCSQVLGLRSRVSHFQSLGSESWVFSVQGLGSWIMGPWFSVGVSSLLMDFWSHSYFCLPWSGFRALKSHSNPTQDWQIRFLWFQPLLTLQNGNANPSYKSLIQRCAVFLSLNNPTWMGILAIW